MDFVSDPSNKPSGVEKPVRIEAGFQILHDGKALSGFPHTSIRFPKGKGSPLNTDSLCITPDSLSRETLSSPLSRFRVKESFLMIVINRFLDNLHPLLIRIDI